MTILLLLIPVSLLLLCVAVWFLVWGVRSGQYDDLDSPGHRILFEDDAHMIPKDARTPEQEKKLQTQASNKAKKQKKADE